MGLDEEYAISISKETIKHIEENIVSFKCSKKYEHESIINIDQHILIEHQA